MRDRQFQYFDKSAKKQTVSLTINSDLYAKAKEVGVNVSQIAEEALAVAFTHQMKEKIRAEVQQDAEAYDAFVRKYGSPAELARQHYAEKEAAENSSTDKEDAV